MMRIQLSCAITTMILNVAPLVLVGVVPMGVVVSAQQPYITTLFCRCEQPDENLYDWQRQRRTSFMGDEYTMYLDGANTKNNDNNNNENDVTGYFQPPKPTYFQSRYYQFLTAIMSMFRNEPGTKDVVDKYIVQYSITILPKNDPICMEQNMDYDYDNNHPNYRRLEQTSSKNIDEEEEEEWKSMRMGRKGQDLWRGNLGPFRGSRGNYWSTLFRDDDENEHESYSGKGGSKGSKGKGKGSNSKAAKSSKSGGRPKPSPKPDQPQTRPPKEPKSPPQRPKIFRCPDRGTPFPDTIAPTMAPTMNSTSQMGTIGPTDTLEPTEIITLEPTDVNNATDFPTSNFQTFAPTSDDTMGSTTNSTTTDDMVSAAPSINIVPVPTVPTPPPTPAQRRRGMEHRQINEQE